MCDALSFTSILGSFSLAESRLLNNTIGYSKLCNPIKRVLQVYVKIKKSLLVHYWVKVIKNI